CACVPSGRPRSARRSAGRTIRKHACNRHTTWRSAACEGYARVARRRQLAPWPYLPCPTKRKGSPRPEPTNPGAFAAAWHPPFALDNRGKGVNRWHRLSLLESLLVESI